MCVIIYVPKESSISNEELLEAWTTNPDGAGFAIQKDGKVEFSRGYMNFPDFEQAVTPLIGNYNLLLHFRISTSKAVNKVQTHPYKKGNVTLTEGTTEKPVICMNGIVSKQTTYKDCNDTMSYIIDHEEAFANINQDIINIIETATGAKWAVMTPKKVFLSSLFEEEDGRFYSNKNHLYYSYFTSYYEGGRYKSKKYMGVESVIKNKKLRQSLEKDFNLCNDVLDYIYYNCSYADEPCDCTKCLKSCKTLRDIKTVLKENWYYDPYDYYVIDNTEGEAVFTEDKYNDKCFWDE